MSNGISVEIRPYLVSLRYSTELQGETIVFGKPVPSTDGEGRTHVPRPLKREDLYALRERLFDVKTLKQALALAREYGPLYKDGGEGVPATLAHFEKLRDFARKALLSPDKDHLDIGWNLQLEIQQGSPVWGFKRCDSVAEAIQATLQVDRLRGNPWLECGACGKPFEKTDERERLYCSQRCARLQAARSYKLRTRKALNPRAVVPSS